VSGDDVKGSKRPDAQQNVPTGAGTARPAGDGEKSYARITWVGSQHLMHGYCGRVAVVATGAEGSSARPRQRPRTRPLRIAPRPPAETAGAPARAA
jgi:hypothetical protein